MLGSYSPDQYPIARPPSYLFLPRAFGVAPLRRDRVDRRSRVRRQPSVASRARKCGGPGDARRRDKPRFQRPLHKTEESRAGVFAGKEKALVEGRVQERADGTDL